MSRPINVILSIISVLISAFILKQDLTSPIIFYTCIVVAGFTIFSNLINDIFDIEADKLNRPLKPLVTGKISVQTVFLIAILLLIICIYFTTELNKMASDIVYFLVFPIIITYTPIFKSIPFIGNILIGATLGFVFLFSEASLLNQMELMRIPALLAMHLTILRELLKDIEDHEGDCKSRINTFPVCFGINHSLRLFLLLTILLFGWAGFLPVFMELNKLYIILFWGLFSPWIFYIIYLLFWKNSDDYSKASNLLKIATGSGLVVIASFGI